MIVLRLVLNSHPRAVSTPVYCTPIVASLQMPYVRRQVRDSDVIQCQLVSFITAVRKQWIELYCCRFPNGYLFTLRVVIVLEVVCVVLGEDSAILVVSRYKIDRHQNEDQNE